MIKIYGGLKGFTVLLFFFAGIVLLSLVFFWGITKAAELLLPLLAGASGILVIVFLCGVLPLSGVKNLRPYLCHYSMLMSKVLSVSTWMMSFLFVVKTLGFWGIFFSFLFQFLAPLALIAAILKGSWNIAGNLILWITFTYVMRVYSYWLAALDTQPPKKGRIIDVEIEPSE